MDSISNNLETILWQGFLKANYVFPFAIYVYGGNNINGWFNTLNNLIHIEGSSDISSENDNLKKSY